MLGFRPQCLAHTLRFLLCNAGKRDDLTLSLLACACEPRARLLGFLSDVRRRLQQQVALRHGFADEFDGPLGHIEGALNIPLPNLAGQTANLTRSEMPIVLAHPSFPWQDEAISIAMHKPEVYIDLSGWSPKYFPEILIQYTNTRLKNKMLFGSDFPLITPDRWLADFEKIGIRDEVRPLVLKENAAKLLGIKD